MTRKLSIPLAVRGEGVEVECELSRTEKGYHLKVIDPRVPEEEAGYIEKYHNELLEVSELDIDQIAWELTQVVH